MEIADLLEDMNINEQPSNKAVENDADGIDELIAKMDKVNIDK